MPTARIRIECNLAILANHYYFLSWAFILRFVEASSVNQHFAILGNDSRIRKGTGEKTQSPKQTRIVPQRTDTGGTQESSEQWLRRHSVGAVRT